MSVAIEAQPSSTIDVTCKVEDDLTITTPDSQEEEEGSISVINSGVILSPPISNQDERPTSSNLETLYGQDWRNRFPSLVSASLVPYITHLDPIEPPNFATRITVQSPSSSGYSGDHSSLARKVKVRCNRIYRMSRDYFFTAFHCMSEAFGQMYHQILAKLPINSNKVDSHQNSIIDETQEAFPNRDGVLVLTNRELESLPDIGESSGKPLYLLDLSANRLVSLPPIISKFQSIRSLFLNQNRLKYLPYEIGELTGLEILSAAYNFLTDLPASISNLINLRELKLSSNKFIQFPKELITLPKLELLDLSMNKITEMPNGFSQMQLVDLNLNENQISYLSDDIGSMPKIQILRLQNNQINLNSIPDNIFSASLVSQVLFEGNLFELDSLAAFEDYDEYLQRNQMLRRNSRLVPTSNLEIH